MSDRVLLLTKKNLWCNEAAKLAYVFFGGELVWEQSDGHTAPESFSGNYRAVVSFLSPWIVPAGLLEHSRIAINFHPGSCDYPGIGCYNFALYEGAKRFGAVCHHMLPAVDSGEVIQEVLFNVLPQDTVETLKLRTMIAMLAMYHDILGVIATGKKLPIAPRQWIRKAFTRKQLNALCEVTPDMSESEAKRRILATTYPGYPGPYLLKDGRKEFYPVPPGPALA